MTGDGSELSRILARHILNRQLQSEYQRMTRSRFAFFKRQRDGPKNHDPAIKNIHGILCKSGISTRFHLRMRCVRMYSSGPVILAAMHSLVSGWRLERSVSIMPRFRYGVSIKICVVYCGRDDFSRLIRFFRNRSFLGER